MANIISENIFSPADNEGNWYVLLNAITDYQKTEGCISGDTGFITLKNDMKQRCQRALGWNLCLQ
jgi:hypothetical protein